MRAPRWHPEDRPGAPAPTPAHRWYRTSSATARNGSEINVYSTSPWFDENILKCSADSPDAIKRIQLNVATDHPGAVIRKEAHRNYTEVC